MISQSKKYKTIKNIIWKQVYIWKKWPLPNFVLGSVKNLRG